MNIFVNIDTIINYYRDIPPPIVGEITATLPIDDISNSFDLFTFNNRRDYNKYIKYV